MFRRKRLPEEMKVSLLEASDNQWPADDVAAAERASKYLRHDPFPNVPAALLGSATFADYARVTGMVYPFKGFNRDKQEFEKGLVKPASYEVRPGDSFFYFDVHGYRRCIDIGPGAKERFIHLRANSITFCSTDERFRLPNYIAMRFNLRIKHVHRGILLGTGPLVDPGFDKKLLIPLHNLTDSDYFISLDEGLIWVEFTKTYLQAQAKSGDPYIDVNLPDNTQKDFNKFFMEASGGQPIRSSIPTAIDRAEQKAERAEREVQRLAGVVRNIEIVGIIAIIVALFSIVVPVIDLVRSVAEQIHR
jgi:deoxycytidine triphosphate deaminase